MSTYGHPYEFFRKLGGRRNGNDLVPINCNASRFVSESNNFGMRVVFLLKFLRNVSIFSSLFLSKIFDGKLLIFGFALIEIAIRKNKGMW